MLSLLGIRWKASKPRLQSRVQVQLVGRTCDTSKTVVVQSSLLLCTQMHCYSNRHEQQTPSCQSHSIVLAESVTMQTVHVASQQGSRPGSGHGSYNPQAGLPKDSSTWGTKPGSDKDYTMGPSQVAHQALHTHKDCWMIVPSTDHVAAGSSAMLLHLDTARDPTAMQQVASHSACQPVYDASGMS